LFLRSGSPQNVHLLLSAAAASEFPPRALPTTEADLPLSKQ
jgi:hypothetical protein